MDFLYLIIEYDLKFCNTCGMPKPRQTHFHRSKASPDGFVHICKECQSEYAKEHYRRNSSSIRKRVKEYRADNRDSILDKQRIYYSENKDAFRERNTRWQRDNPDRMSITRKKWSDANPDKVRGRGKLYRARKAGAAEVPFAPEQLAQRWAYYGDKCWICRGPATETDHVKPISKGGAHMLCNLRPACTPCNRTKSNRWPLEQWLADRRNNLKGNNKE